MTSDSRVLAVPGTGADVLLGPAGDGVVRTRSGRFLRLEDPPAGLADALAGGRAGDSAASEYADRLRTELAARECRDADERWPAERRGVRLIGAGETVDALTKALPGCAIDGRAPRPQLVIAVAETPRERAHWAELDTYPARGVAWLRAYREGATCFVDPIAVTTDDPGSEQVRRRRLAASPVPRELAAWQRTVASAAAPLPVAARTLLLARVLTVALAWAQDAPALEAYRRTLWRLGTSSMTITEHSLLGYDEPPVGRR